MNIHRSRPGRRLQSRKWSERGFALVSVLVLLAFGALLIPPLLSLIVTSMELQDVHETSLRDFYAADAAVEDALWQIKSDELPTLFPDYDDYAYTESYTYSDYPGSAHAVALNETDVDVTIENVWIPDSIDAPTSEEAQQRIDDAILVVTGSVTDTDTYRIRVTYDYQKVTDPDWDELAVDKLSIWLPAGFEYVEDSSNLEERWWEDYYCVPECSAYKGGQVVVWDFIPDVSFMDMPGVRTYDYPLVSSITFRFTSSGGGMPDAAVAWISTTGVSDVDYAWDADVRVFRILATATDPDSGSSTTVDAYTARQEMRHISAAIPGDYYATGNSLLTSTDYNDDFRDRLYRESSADVPTDDTGDAGIPTHAIPEAAYLYWTGWIDWHDYDPQPLFYDSCYNMGNWSHGSHWRVYWGEFEGGGPGTPASDALTLNHSLDLSAYEGNSVTISWDQGESGRLSSSEGLFYAFSGNGGESWSGYQVAFLDDDPASSFSTTIPEEYLTDDFRVLFTFNLSRSRYVYLDNITITGGGGSLEYPDNPTTENLTTLIEDTARTNVIMLQAEDADAIEVTADAWQLEPTTGSDWAGTWSYCCVADVSDLVEQWIEDGYLDNNASGSYTLGHRIAENQADPDYAFDLYVPTGPDPETGYPLGTPAPRPYGGGYGGSPNRYQYSHAGWSLIVIYTSPETKGHQLYLFDIRDPEFSFTEAWGPSGNSNPDFDGDGDPGGRIAGFLVPEPIEGETIAAKMTVFVGEGDSLINQDSARLNGTSLYNSASPSTNVWNSASPGMSIEGVDIDTFVIEWNDHILETGDTSAQVDLPTQNDGFNLVYIILSFRSDITSGGTISYLLSG